MTNDEKFNALWEELTNWMEGNDYDGNLEFAFNNDFQYHALSIWQGSWASALDFTVPIPPGIEKQEIKDLLSIAYLLKCKDCNHIGFYDEYYIPESGSQCQSCLSHNTELEPPKEGGSNDQD